LDDVGDDQKITGKPHAGNRPEFEFEPIPVGFGEFFRLDVMGGEPNLQPG
jgi:hypothetical protein